MWDVEEAIGGCGGSRGSSPVGVNVVGRSEPLGDRRRVSSSGRAGEREWVVAFGFELWGGLGGAYWACWSRVGRGVKGRWGDGSIRIPVRMSFLRGW